MQEFYIITPKAKSGDYISEYTLLKKEQLQNSHLEALVIRLPDSIEIHSVDDKFKVYNQVPIKSFDYDLLIKRNGEWTTNHDLRASELRQCQLLLKKKGLHMVPNLGYLNGEEFRKWFRKIHPEIFSQDNKLIQYGSSLESPDKPLQEREIEEYLSGNPNSMMFR